MRLGFVIIVLLVAGVAWKLLELRVDAKPATVIQKETAVPMDLSYERMEALTTVNTIREALQMNTLVENKALTSAAQAHADYLVRNNAMSHNERKGRPGFTGITPADRAVAAGYHSLQVSENLSTKNPHAQSSVDGLFSAIYHRFGFLDPSIDEMGVGVAQDRKKSSHSAFVYLMANSELERLCSTKSFKGVGRYVYGVCRDRKYRIEESAFKKAQNYYKRYNPKIILYPYSGQNGVPPAFYSEIPDPLPDYDVSGFPVSVAFNDYFFKDVKIHSFKLYREGDGKPVKVRMMDKRSDPHHRFSSKQFAIFPLQRLDYDTKYRVELIYEADGKKRKLTWYFRTKKPLEKLYTITKKEESITLKAGESYFLYFRPLDAHDVIENIQYPADLDVHYIDNNTLRISLDPKRMRSFDLIGGKRVLHIAVQ